MGNLVTFLRELDARNAPVQFDEREEETELRQTGLRRPGENLTIRHREANVTAPLLDSTQLTGWAFEGCCMQVARDCLNATTTGVALVNTRGHV